MPSGAWAATKRKARNALLMVCVPVTSFDSVEMNVPLCAVCCVLCAVCCVLCAVCCVLCDLSVSVQHYASELHRLSHLL